MNKLERNSGMNWEQYERQYVQAVDMCAAAIFVNRVKFIPVKAIYLWPLMYEQFKWWAEKKMKREIMPEEGLEFDGVRIEKGDKSQATPLLIELWDSAKETQKAIIELTKYQKMGKA